MAPSWDWNSLNTQISSYAGKHRFAVESIEADMELLKACENQESRIALVQSILQQLAQQIQQKAHKQIAKVVSKCLSAVFKEPYELRIEFERKRGKTEANFIYLRDGYKVNPRLTSGGVRDVTALALRLASLVMALPPRRRLLILDEPFKGVSGENLQKVAVLLETLSQDLKCQFILVTHNPTLEVGKVIQL